eukprot:92419_1
MTQPLQNEEQKKPEKTKSAIPRYHVNLDAPANKRWEEVINDYKDHFQQIEKIINDLISTELGKTGTFLKSLISSTMSTLTKCGAVYYKDELSAIANQSKMSLGLLVVMQLIYESSAHCTSIICNDEKGKPIHIRTMDWEMEFLRPMTIEVEFYRNNKPIAICTTWAGYVGILTGLRYGINGFSVAVNFRVTGDGLWQNIKKAMSGSWPIGFLVRETLTQESDINYQKAKSILQKSALIAPVYFTMSGYNKNDGCLITRNRENDTKLLQLNCENNESKQDSNYNLQMQSGDMSEEKKVNINNENDENENGFREFLIQTNIDHWSSYWADNIMWSIQRRTIACNELKKINNKANYNKLWQLVTKHPIFNEITVYGTLMSVSNWYLETRLPHKINGFMVNNKDKNKENDNDN